MALPHNLFATMYALPNTCNPPRIYYLPPRVNGAHIVQHSPGELSEGQSKFQLLLNVKQFKPDELSVKTVDNFVVIHGKHEEHADEHGLVSREFTRRYAIPDGVEADKIRSFLNQDGVLTVQAPRKAAELPKNERVIPITMLKPTHLQQLKVLKHHEGPVKK